MRDTLFVTDLDGTLLDPSGSLRPESAAILNALIDGGLRFTYATARSQYSAAGTVRGLRLREPVLAYNGALCTSPDGREVFFRASLRYAEAREALDALLREGFYPIVHGRVRNQDRVAWLAGQETPGIRQYLGDRPGDSRQQAVPDAGELFAGELLNIALIGPAEWVARAQALLQGHPLLSLHLQADTYRAESHWLEVQHRDATKARGVRRLQQMLGLPQLVCFGDNYNDLSMFRVADEGYAVANAVPELRAAATGVIGGNREDGVARYLRGRREA